MKKKIKIIPLIVGLLFIGLVNTLISVDEPDRSRTKMAMSVNPGGVADFFNDAVFDQLNDAAGTRLKATETATTWMLKVAGWLLILWAVITLGVRVMGVKV